MTAPYVSVAAALAIEEVGPGWSPAGISSLLSGTAIDLGPSGPDNDYGFGLIDPVAMLNHVNTHFLLRVPSTTTIAPGAVPVSGRLLLPDGTPPPASAGPGPTDCP